MASAQNPNTLAVLDFEIEVPTNPTPKGITIDASRRLLCLGQLVTG